ncbi:hypothetical protein ABZ135_29010 [Streptomyces sp. NPDC006339]|uniref:hypothetical protein n=1 Tax=Streptomyces sp. NPDC006339 TaxID=3156755 RepID=UPI0033A3C632
MSGTAFTGVNSEGGPVHTGTGPQHNHFYFHEVKASGASPLRPLAADHLAWLAQRFVAPTGMNEAARLLDRLGTLLLDGTPGSGRNATARMLLHKTPGHRVPRQLLPEDDNASPDLRGEQVGDGDRLLLDLSDTDGPVWDDLQEKLPALHQTVRERGAHLVVIVPHATGHLRDHLAAHRRTIVRPDGTRVLMRALRQEESPLVETPEELAPPVHAYLATAPPLRDVARLARLLAEARQAEPGKGTERWCELALTSLRDLGRRVATDIATLEDGSQRALLLATAMLPGARPEALHSVTELLLRTVGHPADDRPLLEREDLSQRFWKIGASVRPDGAVVFDLPDYAAAVRGHFWMHRPGMWSDFQKWVDRSVRLASLDGQDRDALVAGYAEQSLRTGQRRPLLAQAREWSAEGDPRLVQAAVQALGHGLSDMRAGREFRQQVYSWSVDDKTPTGLARALVAVSADVIADSHPDQALVRLHHLARRADARSTDAVRRLLALALPDERLHGRLLRRVANDLVRHSERGDIELFRACAEPPRVTSPRRGGSTLVDDPIGRELLTSSWRALFTTRDRAAWLPAAEEWIAAAHPRQAHADALLDVLVEAAGDSPAVLALLYVTALRYPCSALLRHKVDAAQGIRPAS